MFSDNRAKHLGQIYRLIEQFELISRSDLAKLSGLAPASVTNLTKTLIEQHFILERTVQYNQSRGRPAVGLAVSHFFWRLLSLTISPQKIEISLCKLNGEQIYQKNHILSQKDYPNLSNHLVSLIERFSKVYRLEYCNILAVSVSVVGKIDINRENITQLGNVNLHCAIKSKLSPLFNCPVLVSEHFQLWLLAESTLGSLIRHNNVIFLQLDDTINLSVLLNGSLLHKHSRMNIDNIIMPQFSELSDAIFPELIPFHRYQLANQITFPAILRLIDNTFPNKLNTQEEKIALLCKKINENQPLALKILEHITDNLSYALMNLVNIFSSERIMLNSPLLQAKETLFARLSEKLHLHLPQECLNIDLATSQYEWNSPLIACSAIKQGIYEGNLIKDSIRASVIS